MLNAELISKVSNVKRFTGNKTDYILIEIQNRASLIALIYEVPIFEHM